MEQIIYQLSEKKTVVQNDSLIQIIPHFLVVMHIQSRRQLNCLLERESRSNYVMVMQLNLRSPSVLLISSTRFAVVLIHEKHSSQLNPVKEEKHLKNNFFLL